MRRGNRHETYLLRGCLVQEVVVESKEGLTKRDVVQSRTIYGYVIV